MANVKIIDLPTGSPEYDSFLEATQVNEQAASGRSSAKIAFNAFANWIAGQGADPVEYGDLNTEDKTLIGGINELHNAIGALVDDTTISTVSTWSSKKISSEVDEVYPLGTASGSVAEFETSLVKPFANTRFNVSGNDITSMNIFVRGHNVWDGELEIRDGRLCSKNAIRVLSNTTYFFGTTRLYDIYLYDKNMTYLGKPSYTGLSDGYTFNTGSNCAYIQFALGGGTTEPDPFPINYPSTEHNYYEYVGQDVTVTWETAIDNGYVDTVNGIVYDTDNDTTESITPITIKSVNGQNYVWCDTGTSIIGYREALNIADLTDVDLTSPTDGQLLRYNGTSGKWENAGIINDTTASASSVYSSNKTDTLLSSKANSTDVYTKTQVDTALSGKQDTLATTATISRHPNAPSSLPLAAIQRYGKLVIVSFVVKLEAGTYYELYNVTPVGAGQTEAVVLLGTQANLVSVFSSGLIRFNNSVTLTQSTYLIGELVYMTA